MRKKSTLSIACASGFWGDTPLAVSQLLQEPALDYIGFDYLSEVTMTILAKLRQRDSQAGYVADFFTDVIEPHLKEISVRKIKLVSNAGGMNPLALKKKIDEFAYAQKIELSVVCVLEDDLLSSLPESGYASANVYLGAMPIVQALAKGADIVLTGRCVDTALFVAPLVHELHIPWDDYAILAAASLAGHILECGTQCTGGNFTDWKLIEQKENIGFPIVNFHANGTFEVTKPKNTGGLVSNATVSEQIVYEIADPRAYLLPDVSCDFSNVRLHQKAKNIVEVSGAQGSPPTSSYKVSATKLAGFKVATTAIYGGANALEKAQSAGENILARANRALRERKLSPYSATLIETLGDSKKALLRLSAAHQSTIALEILAKEIAPAATSLAPGLTNILGGRAHPTPRVELSSFQIEKSKVLVKLDTGENIEAYYPNFAPVRSGPVVSVSVSHAGNSKKIRLGEIAYARSGDKGNNVNIGVIARNASDFESLKSGLSKELIAEFFKNDFDDPNHREVESWDLPGIYAINFLLKDCLGGGGAFSLRIDPQGKAYGQRLLDLMIAIPEEKTK